ncbi:MAG: glycosyltransferase family 2 protein [Alphaproteobacteria bacterium]|nr:glycosyltransferase family 2 protein [Alphaproteobacteria bacterium]
MPPKLPISVFIIAKNEADRISHTIKSVRDWVDEVIVIDSGSSDETIVVSETLGARTVWNAWQGYGPQKVFGESLCKNDWLLNLDADEEVSSELAEEVQSLFKAGEPDRKGYILKIKALYRFQKTLPKWAPGTRQLRLYHKKYAGFKDSTVHDSVVMKNNQETKELDGVVIHRCFRSYTHATEKINFYTSMQAEDLFKRGVRFSSAFLIITPFISFFKCYFLRKYFLYGVDGFIQSCIYAFNRLLRLAKLRELWQEHEHVQMKID